MYSQPFKFEFNVNVSHSERMSILSDMFLELESKENDSLNYYGYEVKQGGPVKIVSSTPDLTAVLKKYLSEQKKLGRLKIFRPIVSTLGDIDD